MKPEKIQRFAKRAKEAGLPVVITTVAGQELTAKVELIGDTLLFIETRWKRGQVRYDEIESIVFEPSALNERMAACVA